jgi:hypothetical protein
LPNRAQILHVLKRLLFILIGYALASIASGIVVGLVFAWNDIINKTDFQIMLSYTLSICAVVTLFIAMYAALPAAVTVLIGETTPNRNKFYYSVAGCLIGGALPVFVEMMTLVPIGLIFGPVAGLIYWRVAGRNAGLWQPKAA